MDWKLGSISYAPDNIGGEISFTLCYVSDFVPNCASVLLNLFVVFTFNRTGSYSSAVNVRQFVIAHTF